MYLYCLFFFFFFFFQAEDGIRDLTVTGVQTCALPILNVSVIGAAGYTGGELIRLLVNHPNVTLVSAVSQSQQGKKLSSVFTDLIGEKIGRASCRERV